MIGSAHMQSTVTPFLAAALACLGCDQVVQDPADSGPLGEMASAGASAGSHFLRADGPLQLDPATGLFFFEESHQGGNAGSVKIASTLWGRLVDVYEETHEPANPALIHRRLRMKDLLIDPQVIGQTTDWALLAPPTLGREQLVIKHALQSPQFLQVLQSLAVPEVVLPKGIGPPELPPFTAVPRNGAVAIQMDDLLDHASITPETVRVLVGLPPTLPFELRILPDPCHGGIAAMKFHSTRVLLDFAVSVADSKQAGGNVPVNPQGLPAAVDPGKTNVVVRIPTKIAGAQQKLLTNLAGHPLSFTNNGPNDPGSATLDVIRAFRSGGKTSVTGDPHEGFLRDEIQPSLVATQPIDVTKVVGTKIPGEFRLRYGFGTAACAVPGKVGDVLRIQDRVAVLLEPGMLSGALVNGARVVVVAGPSTALPTGAGEMVWQWNPAQGAPSECFARFSPAAGTLPSSNVSTSASVIMSFSEPMEPATVQALDRLSIDFGVPPNANPMWAKVIGEIAPALDLQEFPLQPAVPLRHAQGSAEEYFIEVVGDDPATSGLLEGVKDLAGNPLRFGMVGNQRPKFTLEPSDPTVDSAGIGFKFSSLDEDGNGTPELRGQFVLDPLQEVIKPRSVSRFSVVMDSTQPMMAVMFETPQGLVTPLSPFGSKLMSVWRYVDMGFSLLDDANHNLDVERLHWSPFNSAVQADSFSQFQIALAHGFFLTDETVNAGLLPVFHLSGLVPTFDQNLLSPGRDPLTVVASKADGYTIDPQLAFQSSSSLGTIMMPWPINLNIPLSKYTYWTYRDTAKLQLGGCTGPGCGPGADPLRVDQVNGLGFGKVGFYPQGKIPTIGLPLLKEFRCYPDHQALGLNSLKTSFALNTSYKPTFRAYSTGGVFNGNVTTIDPDNEPVAQGGINSSNGSHTLPIDNTVYWGQADFVVRVSRLHSIWLDTGAGHDFGKGVLEPAAQLQPNGTSVSLAFRGASQVTAASGKPWENAEYYDPYGDGFTAQQLLMIYGPPPAAPPAISVTYFPNAGDNSWNGKLPDLDGARWVQLRVSFLSNAENNATAELSGMGIAFQK